jgi:hypothetical protein
VAHFDLPQLFDLRLNSLRAGADDQPADRFHAHLQRSGTGFVIAVLVGFSVS